jgi:hypothetical protein
VYRHHPKTNTFAGVVPAFSRLAIQETTCLEQRTSLWLNDKRAAAHHESQEENDSGSRA